MAGSLPTCHLNCHFTFFTTVTRAKTIIQPEWIGVMKRVGACRIAADNGAGGPPVRVNDTLKRC